MDKISKAVWLITIMINVMGLSMSFSMDRTMGAINGAVIVVGVYYLFRREGSCADRD